jgi:CHAD domain-containing protein
VIALLDQPRYLALVLETAAWIQSGRWSDPADPQYGPKADAPLSELARDGLNRLRRQIKRRGAHLKALDPASRHKLRIRAKRLRYALEFFAGLYGAKESERVLARVKGLQDDLGALNDLKVARERGLALAEGGGRAAGDSETEGAQEAFAAGLMIGVRLADEAALLERAWAAYEALMEVKPFWR